MKCWFKKFLARPPPKTRAGYTYGKAYQSSVIEVQTSIFFQAPEMEKIIGVARGGPRGPGPPPKNFDRANFNKGPLF